jgi:phosphate/sulfate permease
MDVQFVLVALILGLAFANGTNDVSKAIATLVGSGITNYHTAIVWGTVWTVLGANTRPVLFRGAIQLVDGIQSSRHARSPRTGPATCRG